MSILAADSAAPFAAAPFSAVAFSRKPAKPCLVFSGLRRFLNSPRSSSLAEKVFTEPIHSSRPTAHPFQLLKREVLLSHALASRIHHSSIHSPRMSSLSK